MTGKMGPLPPKCECGDAWTSHEVILNGPTRCMTYRYVDHPCRCDRYQPRMISRAEIMREKRMRRLAKRFLGTDE